MADPTGTNLTDDEVRRWRTADPIAQALQIPERLQVLQEDVDGLSEASSAFEASVPVFQRKQVTVSLAFEANDTRKTLVPVAFAEATVAAIKVVSSSAPSSAAGGFTLAVAAGGTNLLDDVSFDLEGLQAGVVESLALTETAEDLVLAEDDVIEFTVTSDNADLACDDLSVTIVLEPTLSD